MDIFHFFSDINSSAAIIYVLIRTLIIYIFAIFLVRMTNRFHLDTTFDFVLIVIIGAVLGRTIYGGASLITTMLASLLLILLHRVIAISSFHSHKFGRVVKGEAKVLFSKNQFHMTTMRQLQITETDILEACRKQLHKNSLESISEVRLERTGNLSFILKG